MATEKQIAANRRNAQKSTGPVTELGKGVARFNALKHGMTAITTVLPYEDAHAYAELRESLVAHYHPENPVEAMLVETIANSYWRLLRARRIETGTMGLAIETLKRKNDLNPDPREDDDNALAVFFTNGNNTLRDMERYHSKIERCYFQAIETLRKVQKERLREERLTTAQAKQIGFVSQPQKVVAATVPHGGKAPRPVPVRYTETAIVPRIDPEIEGFRQDLTSFPLGE